MTLQNLNNLCYAVLTHKYITEYTYHGVIKQVSKQSSNLQAACGYSYMEEIVSREKFWLWFLVWKYVLPFFFILSLSSLVSLSYIIIIFILVKIYMTSKSRKVSQN